MLAVRNWQDLAAGIFFIVVAMLIYWIASDYPMGTLRSIGPGFLPKVLAVAMGVLALIMLLRSLGGDEVAIEGLALRPLFFILAGSLAFGLLVRPAGVFVALVVMVLMGCAASREIGVRQALLTALGLAVGSIVIFVYALGLPMPVLGRWFG